MLELWDTGDLDEESLCCLTRAGSGSFPSITLCTQYTPLRRTPCIQVLAPYTRPDPPFGPRQQPVEARSLGTVKKDSGFPRLPCFPSHHQPHPRLPPPPLFSIDYAPTSTSPSPFDCRLGPPFQATAAFDINFSFFTSLPSFPIVRFIRFCPGTGSTPFVLPSFFSSPKSERTRSVYSTDPHVPPCIRNG